MDKSEISVRLPITPRRLAGLLGISLAQTMATLRFELRFNAYSLDMELPPDVVVTMGEHFGCRVRLVRGGQPE